MADDRGAFFVIDVYDGSPCHHGSEGPDWLTDGTCLDASKTPRPNNLPTMLRNGSVKGVTLRVDWDVFKTDTAGTLQTVLNTINNIAPTNGQIGIKVGMVAGVHTPCHLLVSEAGPNGVAGIWDTAGQNSTNDKCLALPSVWANAPGANDFANSYAADLGSLVATVNGYLTSLVPSRLAVSAIKLSGLSGRDLETHIPGNNVYGTDPVGQPTNVCRDGTTLNATCPSDDPRQNGVTPASLWLNSFGYYPPGVESAWNIINQSVISNILPTFDHLVVLESEDEQSQEFPPIAAPGGVNPPTYNCSPVGVPYKGYPECQLYGGGNPQQADNIGRDFTESVLLTDLLSGMSGTVAPSSVGVQYNGLAPGNPVKRSLQDIPSCWAQATYRGTVIGLQSSIDPSNDPSGDGSAYLSGLTYGYNFDPDYEELLVWQVNEYVNSGSNVSQRMANIAAVQTRLTSNNYVDPGYCFQ